MMHVGPEHSIAEAAEGDIWETDDIQEVVEVTSMPPAKSLKHDDFTKGYNSDLYRTVADQTRRSFTHSMS